MASSVKSKAVSASEATPQTNGSLDVDKEVKFDRELDWCIQKLNSKLLKENDIKKGNFKAINK